MGNFIQLKHLKNQLDIYQDESLSSYLFRLSQCNHYHNVNYLAEFLGLSAYQAQNNEFTQEALRKLSDLNEGLVSFGIKNGCKFEERIGSDLYTRILMKNKVKYCPLCIQDKNYHRTIWMGIPFHLCIEHRVKLVDQCPKCGYLISMAAFINHKCDKCSFDYIETESLVIENTIFIESQKQISQGLWNENFLVLKNCNFINFFKLAFHSFHLLNGATDYISLTSEKLLLFYNRSNGEKSGFILANALANVYWMFNDFPNHFFFVLDDILTHSYSVSNVVNAGYLTPIQIANSPIKQFQLDEVNKFMENCSGQIVTKLKPNFIRFHDVLIKFSTSSLTIDNIISFTLSGHLKPSRILTEGNLADNFYEENEIKACLEIVKRKKQEEEGYFFQDVMKKLKIGEKRLWKVLTEHGIAADFTLYMKDGRKRYYFKEDTISKIQRYLSRPG